MIFAHPVQLIDRLGIFESPFREIRLGYPTTPCTHRSDVSTQTPRTMYPDRYHLFDRSGSTECITKQASEAQTISAGIFPSPVPPGSLAKHSRRSFTSNLGASHAGISTASRCLLTHAIGHAAAPHISGVAAPLRKLLMPSGTSQYALHEGAEVSMCALRSQRSPASAPGSHILEGS